MAPVPPRHHIAVPQLPPSAAAVPPSEHLTTPSPPLSAPLQQQVCADGARCRNSSAAPAQPQKG